MRRDRFPSGHERDSEINILESKSNHRPVSGCHVSLLDGRRYHSHRPHNLRASASRTDQKTTDLQLGRRGFFPSDAIHRGYEQFDHVIHESPRGERLAEVAAEERGDAADYRLETIGLDDPAFLDVLALDGRFQALQIQAERFSRQDVNRAKMDDV